MSHQTVHRIAARGRSEWYDDMRFGTAVTREQGQSMSNEDRVLLRLLRGPALRSELLELTRHCSDCIEILNRRIVGRRIVASWTDITTRLGLHVKVRRYELVKVAA